MKFIGFDDLEIKDIEFLLPSEQRSLVRRRLLRGGVVSMAREYVGSVVWRATDNGGELVNLFVLPEARRLGAGGILLESAVRQMRAASLSEIHFKYSDVSERTTLTPFFNDEGYKTFVRKMPLGSLTLGEITEALKSKKADKADPIGECLYDMTNKDRTAVCDELFKISGQDMNIYDDQWPGTYVIRDNDIEAAAFIREERENVISLDYLFSNGSPKILAGFLTMIVNRLNEHYDPDTTVEMLLATDEGVKLYESLFGEIDATYRVASCRQSLTEF